jgi:RimJ/RimL family protein N-acetyltransferase
LRGPPTLTTTRLILRPFGLGDADAVQRLAGDPDIARTTKNIPHPYPDGAAGRWISTHEEEFASGRGCTVAVVERGTGALVGAIGLALNLGNRRAELGYWIGKPWWGRGYATEAAGAVIGYGFEGRLRCHLFKDGQFEDLEVYGILREEWEGRPP